MHEGHTSSSQAKDLSKTNIKKEQATWIAAAFSAETKGQAWYELQELQISTGLPSLQ